MSDAASSSPRRKRWIIAIVLLVVYVPSVGPVVWVTALITARLPVRDGYHFHQFADVVLSVIYFPLRWLAHQSPLFDELLMWYVNLT